MPGFIRNPRYPGYPATAQQLYAMLGLSPTGKLPIEGMPPRFLDGFSVRVAPIPAGPMPRGWKRSTHRVLATCPTCLREMSAGRLKQHRC